MNPDSLPPVLVVDDSDDDLYLLKRSLSKGRITNPVATFRAVPEAIAFLETARSSPASDKVPCIVITDLKMPGLDGIAFTKWIRAHQDFAEMPVVMISGSGMERDYKEAKAAGADRFFAKFPRADELGMLIHVARRGKRSVECAH